MKRVLPLFVLMLSLTPAAWGREKAPEWVETIGAIAVQDSGRTMPLDTYAKNLAVQLTGRAHWKEGRGPNGFSGKHRVQLLCDLLLHTETLFEQELITIEDRPLKTKIGLDPKRKFFSPVELANLAGLREVIDGYMQAREADPQFRATKQQQRAMAAWSAVETIGAFAEGKELRIVPSPDGPDFLSVGLFSADPGAEDVQAALAALRTAYVNQQGIQKAVTDLVIAIKRAGTLDKDTARRVSLEVFYNNHRPWMQTAFAYGLAIVLLGLSRIFLRRTLLILGGLAAVWGTIEQIIG
ncbi:MAG: hypothetical protein KAS72_05955, partial [Phycisphaerales bacterium]|nr:hypothetical protein [Phycisphaerales bacterium]